MNSRNLLCIILLRDKCSNDSVCECVCLLISWCVVCFFFSLSLPFDGVSYSSLQSIPNAKYIWERKSLWLSIDAFIDHEHSVVLYFYFIFINIIRIAIGFGFGLGASIVSVCREAVAFCYLFISLYYSRIENGHVFYSTLTCTTHGIIITIFIFTILLEFHCKKSFVFIFRHKTFAILFFSFSFHYHHFKQINSTQQLLRLLVRNCCLWYVLINRENNRKTGKDFVIASIYRQQQ